MRRGPQRVAFSVKTEQVTPRLHVRVSAASGAPPVFVGRDLTQHTDGEVELWKPDPHGMAWVDVEGSSRPEIFITRAASWASSSTHVLRSTIATMWKGS